MENFGVCSWNTENHLAEPEEATHDIPDIFTTEMKEEKRENPHEQTFLRGV